MSGNNLLGIDLNEVANEAIAKRINDLEEENQTLQDEYADLRRKNKTLSDELLKIKSDSDTLLTVFNHIRENFKNLSGKPETEKEYAKSQVLVRYEFIRDLMVFVFNIKEHHGFVSDGSLGNNLAANYYDSKPHLLSIIDLIGADINTYGTSLKGVISEFVHPKYYTKDRVLKYVKSPNNNTNGYHNGFDTLIKGWGTPHDMIQSNPIMLDEDVFTEVLETIKNKIGYYHLLFQMYKYASLTDDHIAKMGDLIPSVFNPRDNTSEIKNFIKDNISKFNDSVVRELFDKYCSHENQYKMFHWQNFPLKYQYEYLLERPIDEVLNIVNHYSCPWSVEDKDEFLKRYYRG